MNWTAALRLKMALLVAWLAVMPGASAQVVTILPPTTEEFSTPPGPPHDPLKSKFVYISVHAHDAKFSESRPGWTGINLGLSNVSAENAKVHACISHEQMAARWRAAGASVAGTTAFHEDNLRQCMNDSIQCRQGAASFMATPISHTDHGRAVGVACGKKTQAEADKAALASCEKSRVRRGLAGPCAPTTRLQN